MFFKLISCSLATTTTAYDYLPLALGLSLGLGLPLLLLLGSLALLYLCRWCPRPLRSIIRNRFHRQPDVYCQHCQQSKLFDDSNNPKRSQVSDDTQQYRKQYINNCDTDLARQSIKNEAFVHESPSPLDSSFFNITRTSFLSPSTITLQNSVLIREYSRQTHSK